METAQSQQDKAPVLPSPVPERRLMIVEEKNAFGLPNGWTILSHAPTSKWPETNLMSARKYKDGFLHGPCIFFSPSEEILFIGNWKNGVPHQGVFLLENRDTLVSDGFLSWEGDLQQVGYKARYVNGEVKQRGHRLDIDDSLFKSDKIRQSLGEIFSLKNAWQTGKHLGE